MKHFLTTIMSEINPNVMIGKPTAALFSEFFMKHIFEPTIYEYWKVKNNHMDFEGWPESLKMEVFMENCMKAPNHSELTPFTVWNS